MEQHDTDSDLVAQRRALIDLIAETRSRSIRVALFGSLLHRTDPDGLETDEQRSSNLRVLLDTVRWIDRVNKLTMSKEIAGERRSRGTFHHLFESTTGNHLGPDIDVFFVNKPDCQWDLGFNINVDID